MRGKEGGGQRKEQRQRPEEARTSREGEITDAKDQVLKSKGRYERESQITRWAAGRPGG